jgi:molecular chaperone HscB
VAAVPASPLKAPLEKEESFFSVFGVPERFHQDLNDLERRFYQLSREFHPDRFSTASVELKQQSLQKMSLINEAYQTLRNPERLREYVLQRAGLVDLASKPKVPMELAEEWFEIQDALLENPELASSKLQAFEVHLGELKAHSEREVSALEQKIDAQGISRARADLEKMAQLLQSQSYLTSLDRDVIRIKGSL